MIGIEFICLQNHLLLLSTVNGGEIQRRNQTHCVLISIRGLPSFFDKGWRSELIGNEVIKYLFMM